MVAEETVAVPPSAAVSWGPLSGRSPWKRLSARRGRMPALATAFCSAVFQFARVAAWAAGAAVSAAAAAIKTVRRRILMASAGLHRGLRVEASWRGDCDRRNALLLVRGLPDVPADRGSAAVQPAGDHALRVRVRHAHAVVVEPPGLQDRLRGARECLREHGGRRDPPAHRRALRGLRRTRRP